MSRWIRILVPMALLSTTALLTAAGDESSARRPDPYPLATCPVSGGKLGSMGKPVVIQHGGREIRFCCKGCVPKFEKNAKKYLAKIDAAIIAQQKPIYPLTTCVFSKDPLGDEAVDLVYGNRLVRLCCKRCVRKFEKNPSKYLARLDGAIRAAQGPRYASKTCPISGKPLGSMGKPLELIIGNRLVRLCCKGCEKKAIQNAHEVLAKLPPLKAAGPASRPRKAGASGR